MSGAFSREKTKKKTPVLKDCLPTKEQLFAQDAPPLAENKVDETYCSVAEYIEIHSDLALEDFMHPLRKSVKEFARRPEGVFYDGARVYRDVKLSDFEIQDQDGSKNPCITCYFESGILDSKFVKGVKSDDAPSFGQLLLFTSSHFKDHLFLGKVIRDKQAKETDSERIMIKLKQYKDSKLSVDELMKGSYTMMQSCAFFYMYENLITALNSLDEYSFPMKQYILYGCEYTKVNPPIYLSESTKYKLGEHQVVVLDPTSWPANGVCGLNASQHAALRRALTEEITVIQGPPGTGKTYFGVQLVKVLLDNLSVWNPSRMCPLLVVCHSNVALDHFLEGLLDACKTAKFVRIGDQCQSEILKPYFLRELICRRVAALKGVPQGRLLANVLKNIDEIRSLLNQITDGIISYRTFDRWNVIKPEESREFESGRHYLKWMMGFDIDVNEKHTDGFVILFEDLLRWVDELKAIDANKATLWAEAIRKIIDLLQRGVKEPGNISTRKFKEKDILSLSPTAAQEKYL